MRSFKAFTVGLVALFAPVACNEQYGYWGHGTPNEIVFGIEQNGAAVQAGYELLGLANQGGSAMIAFRDGDGRGRCWYERLDSRLGTSHFENGVAKWTGARLPAEGIAVLANQTETSKRTGPAWTSTDTLSFHAEGFAMPQLDAVAMRAPLVELGIGEITPAPDPTTGALALSTTSDVTVKWTPPADDTSSRVMVAFTTDRAEVRCFDNAETGSSVIAAEWLARLGGADAGAATVTGKLTIATHRQITIYADGGWIVYVVAAHVQRDSAFTMR